MIPDEMIGAALSQIRTRLPVAVLAGCMLGHLLWKLAEHCL